MKTAKPLWIRMWNFFSVRRPFFKCDRCGWKEKREAEACCWQCNGKYNRTGVNGEMHYHA